MESININLSVANKGFTQIVDYVQGSNMIPIVFEITDYDIPSGATANIYIKKPSGAQIYNSCTISENDVTVQPTTQMFAESGKQFGQLQILSGQKILESFLILFDIEKSIVDDDAIESSDEFTALEEAMTSIGDSLADAQQAVEDAQQAVSNANTAIDTVNTAASAANTAATAANNAATAANNAAQELQEKAENGDFSASIQVASTTTGAAGTQASVTNSGTDMDVKLNFTIPKGEKGDPGEVENLLEQPIPFTEASDFAELAPGDTMGELFGQLKKNTEDGVMSLWSGTQIPSDGDLNTISQIGNYVADSGLTVDNCPATSSFRMFVFRSGTGNRIDQLLFEYSGTAYIRSSPDNGSSWNDWVRYHNTDGIIGESYGGTGVNSVDKIMVSFTPASSVGNISSNTTLAVLFGQILKNQTDFLDEETITAAENAGILSGGGITLLNSILQLYLENAIVEKTTIDGWTVTKYADGTCKGYKYEDVTISLSPLGGAAPLSSFVYAPIDETTLPTGITANYVGTDLLQTNGWGWLVRMAGATNSAFRFLTIGSSSGSRNITLRRFFEGTY